MKCPCIDCICVAICQTKSPWRRIEDCVLAENYTYNTDRTNDPTMEDIRDRVRDIERVFRKVPS